jgi:hypothetical protein
VPNLENGGITLLRNAGNYLRVTRRNIPEDLNANQRRCENLLVHERMFKILLCLKQEFQQDKKEPMESDRFHSKIHLPYLSGRLNLRVNEIIGH